LISSGAISRLRIFLNYFIRFNQVVFKIVTDILDKRHACARRNSHFR